MPALVRRFFKGINYARPNSEIAVFRDSDFLCDFVGGLKPDAFHVGNKLIRIGFYDFFGARAVRFIDFKRKV